MEMGRDPWIWVFNPLKTSPVYTQAGVYGKCMLQQNQVVVNRLKAKQT